MAFQEFKHEQDFMDQCGYMHEGVWYPRVTKIVDIKSKPALYMFYGEVGFYRGKEISAKSAEEGTAVHEAVEKIMMGQKPGNMPSAIVPAVRAFLDFIKDVKIKVNPEHVERRIFNPEHRYAGTIDTLATIDGRFGVLDIKTSEAVYRDYNIQTSAYMDALTREFKDLTTRWILRIDQAQQCKNCNATRRTKGGREKVRLNKGKLSAGGGQACFGGEHDWSESKGIIELKEIETPWQTDFKAFLGAKQLWEWEHAEWLKKIGYSGTS
jgi:hypothetical protein